MSDPIINGKPKETNIRVETRTGKDIPNAQYYEMSPFELKQFDFEKKYPGIKVRTNPNPIYNCHGFTFASRRTGLYDFDYSQILEEDGYTFVKDSEILPGDIVLYFNDLGISHSGIVVEIDNDLKIPKVVSKWGKGGEVVHSVFQVPQIYGSPRMYYRITK